MGMSALSSGCCLPFQQIHRIIIIYFARFTAWKKLQRKQMKERERENETIAFIVMYFYGAFSFGASIINEIWNENRYWYGTASRTWQCIASIYNIYTHSLLSQSQSQLHSIISSAQDSLLFCFDICSASFFDFFLYFHLAFRLRTALVAIACHWIGFRLFASAVDGHCRR